jgi:hypothetical protein
MAIHGQYIHMYRVCHICSLGQYQMCVFVYMSLVWCLLNYACPCSKLAVSQVDEAHTVALCVQQSSSQVFLKDGFRPATVWFAAPFDAAGEHVPTQSCCVTCKGACVCLLVLPERYRRLTCTAKVEGSRLTRPQLHEQRYSISEALVYSAVCV